MTEHIKMNEKNIGGLPYGQEKPSKEPNQAPFPKKGDGADNNHRQWVDEHLSDVPLIAPAAKKGNDGVDNREFWSKATSDIVGGNMSPYPKKGTGGDGMTGNKSEGKEDKDNFWF